MWLGVARSLLAYSILRNSRPAFPFHFSIRCCTCRDFLSQVGSSPRFYARLRMTLSVEPSFSVRDVELKGVFSHPVFRFLAACLNLGRWPFTSTFRFFFGCPLVCSTLSLSRFEGRMDESPRFPSASRFYVGLCVAR